jgi:GNAT superfamily N-acetyltransferase
LAQRAEAFWVAEQDGQVIGFARSILQDGVRELTELFVLPGVQSGGVGRELLARAFPANGARYRSIISSPDIRAQALYLKTGVYPRFPIYYFGRSPEAVSVTTDLGFEPISASPGNFEILASLDRSLLGYRRDVTHAWLLGDRQGYLYCRDKVPVGLEVPMINRAAVDYLLARGFHMDSFMAISMSDVPFGKFENYILPSPPFFL